MMVPRTVLITGASGLLGRALVKEFKETEQWTVVGVANSRAQQGALVKVDLLDNNATRDVIHTYKPQLIIHSAAERYCDKVDENYSVAYKLNVLLPATIASLAAEIGASLIYISTDYVFDGTKPPYNESDETNPINKYGETKLEGEKVTLHACPNSCVLRIPVLYGPVEFLKESAVTCLLELLLNTEKSIAVSDYEIRFPTHTYDVAHSCRLLGEKTLESSDINGVFHYSGNESYTKFGMVQCMSKLLDLPMGHVTGDPNPAGGAPRPLNSQLDSSRLLALIGPIQPIPFAEGIVSCLQPYVKCSHLKV